jgi:hypothetical protein
VSDTRPGRSEQQIRIVGGRRMQCKDIPNAAFLDAVRHAPGVSSRPDSWRNRCSVQRELETVVGWLPERLFLAKARGLIRRRLLQGCPCGCRGDYELPEWRTGVRPALPGEVPVTVPCPGPSCARYLYGAVHEHTELQPSGGEGQ